MDSSDNKKNDNHEKGASRQSGKPKPAARGKSSTADRRKLPISRQLRAAHAAKMLNKHDRKEWPAWVKPTFLLLGIVAVIAIAFDLKRYGQQTVPLETNVEQLRSGLDSQPYKDPGGRFSIVAPRGWRVNAPGGPRGNYDVIFYGPKGMQLAVQTKLTDGDTISDLRDILEQRQIALGLNMNIEMLRFKGVFALQRTTNLKLHRVYTLDFMYGDIAHHLMFKAPYEQYDRYFGVIREIIDTYEPRKTEQEESAGN